MGVSIRKLIVEFWFPLLNPIKDVDCFQNFWILSKLTIRMMKSQCSRLKFWWFGMESICDLLVKHLFWFDDTSVFICLLVGRKTGFGISICSFPFLKYRTNWKRLAVELYRLTVGLKPLIGFWLVGLFLAVEKVCKQAK